MNRLAIIAGRDTLGSVDAARYADGCAWVAGEYVPIDEAAIPLLDTGLSRSDLTYDVVGVWDGRFFRLDDHLERLRRGCERLRLTPPLGFEQIREVLIECVRRSGLRESYVEAIVTRGIPPRGGRDPRKFSPRFYAYAIPYVWAVRPEQQAEGVDLVIARGTVRIPAGAVDPSVKNFHWGDLTRALYEAYERGGTQAVLADAEGRLTEGPGFNVFALIDGVLRTPEHGVLEGITRRTVLELADELGIDAVVDDGLRADSLARAEEILLTTTAGGVMGVRSLDGAPVGAGRPGPVTTRLRERYWALHADPRYTTPVDYAASPATA